MKQKNSPTGLILGALITQYSSSHVYLGLRSALPSRLDSRGGEFDGHPERRERLVDPRNNIVQSGLRIRTLSGSGLCGRIGYLGGWTGFPFWQHSHLLMGGVLGVLFRSRSGAPSYKLRPSYPKASRPRGI